MYARVLRPCRTELAWLLISGQVGERLIHLVGDRFVLTALVYHHVCNAKGRERGISWMVLDARLVGTQQDFIRKRERDSETFF